MAFLDERRYPKVFARLILGAFLVHFGFVQYATRTVMTYDGYVEVASLEGEMMLPFSAMVADTVCIYPSPDPCVRAIRTESGMFSRYGLPPGLAWLTGIALPLSMLFCAGMMFLRRET